MKKMKPAEEVEPVAKAFPKLFALAEAVADTPDIKEWIGKRPESQM